MTGTMKTCKRCKETVELSKFSEHSYTRDGKQSWCKLCMREHKQSRRSALKHSVLAR